MPPSREEGDAPALDSREAEYLLALIRNLHIAQDLEPPTTDKDGDSQRRQQRDADEEGVKEDGGAAYAPELVAWGHIGEVGPPR